MIIPLAATAAAAGAIVGALGARALPAYDPSPFAAATIPGSSTHRTPPATVAALAAAGAVLFAGLALLLGASTALPAWLALAGFSLMLVVIDAFHHRLPNALVIPALLSGMVLVAGHGVLTGDPWPVLRALAGAGALFALYLTLAILTPSGIGMGDVKLALVVGLYLAWLGWEPLLYGAAAGWVFGAVASLVVLIKRRLVRGRTRVRSVAFGPSMLAGVLTILLLQHT